MVITDELRVKFKEFIAARSGLYFKDHNVKDLENKIAQRMDSLEIDTPVAYYSYLTTSQQKEDELRELFNVLSINHTYFFRNAPQFRVLKEKVLPGIVEKRRRLAERAGHRLSLRIWSAGCSSGEEPYSIAMNVREVVPDTGNWDIEIVATDASSSALAKAKRGVYGRNSVKSLDKHYLESYFNEVNMGEYAIKSSIKEMVNFGFHNLVCDEFPGGFDIIFCRNVVIYFDFETTFRVMEKFHRSLVDDGHMFIGYSETLHFMQDKFQMEVSDDAIYYGKASRTGDIDRMKSRVSAGKSFEDMLEEIARKEAVKLMGQFVGRGGSLSGRKKDILVEATKKFHLKKYDEALSVIKGLPSEEASSAEVCFLSAEIYVNQGNYVKAEEKIDKLLRIKPFFAPAYYVLGCISVEKGETDKAEESFRKALYVDPEFSLANFHMAGIYKGRGKDEEAIREYRNTVRLLSKTKPSDIIPFSGGFIVSSLMSVCRNNIERIKLGE